MSRAFVASLTLFAAFAVVGSAFAATPIDSKAYAQFRGAEGRFQQPPISWFDETQAALKTEVRQVGRAIDAQGADYGRAWKDHLRWNLLERNLGPRSTVNLAELELVRRWFYSNRPGLESAFFAPLRERLDAYLDAVFTFSHADLRQAYVEKVALVRSQLLRLANDPSDANAAELGRTLGWFERTRQLTAEVAEVRSLISTPNIQLILTEPLIRRFVATQIGEVRETIAVSEEVAVPSTGALQRARTMCVLGSASSAGNVTIDVSPNDRVAEFAIVYQGSIISHCRGTVGPATLHMKTHGSARATKPVYFGTQGFRLGDTKVVPQVTSTVTGISADSALVRRAAGRRADHPQSQSTMASQGRSLTIQNLRAELDERVQVASDTARNDIDQMSDSVRGLEKVLAPLAREGALPHFHGARSSASYIELDAYARKRDQFGAPAPCPLDSIQADVLVRVHVSAINNMGETITGGKRLADSLIQRAAEVAHEEVPLPLMVHARAKRWAVVARKHRPVELQIPQPNVFLLRLTLESLEIEGQIFTAPAVMEATYRLSRNDVGEYHLAREGNLRLDTTLDDERRLFLHEKLNALFGPLLSAGGVVIPDGGLIGALKGMQSRGVHAEAGWVVAGLDVPDAVMQELTKGRDETDDTSEEADDAVDSTLTKAIAN